MSPDCIQMARVYMIHSISTWWRHQMVTFSALLAICAGNSPATGEFPAQRPVTRSFDVFFDLCLNERSGKQSWSWLSETQFRPLWRHTNESQMVCMRMADNAMPLGSWSWLTWFIYIWYHTQWIKKFNSKLLAAISQSIFWNALFE